MPVSSVFHDYLNGPWEQVRGYLIEELEQLQNYVQNLSNSVTALTTASATSNVINVHFEGNGSVLTSGMTQNIVVPYTGTITSVTLLGDVFGQVTVEIYRDSPLGSMPTSYVAGSYGSGSKLPMLGDGASGVTGFSQMKPVTGWAPAINANDILTFYLRAPVAAITQLSISVMVTTT